MVSAKDTIEVTKIKSVGAVEDQPEPDASLYGRVVRQLPGYGFASRAARDYMRRGRFGLDVAIAVTEMAAELAFQRPNVDRLKADDRTLQLEKDRQSAEYDADSSYREVTAGNKLPIAYAVHAARVRYVNDTARADLVRRGHTLEESASFLSGIERMSPSDDPLSRDVLGAHLIDTFKNYPVDEAAPIILDLIDSRGYLPPVEIATEAVLPAAGQVDLTKRTPLV